MQTPAKVSYLQCPEGNIHQGQNLNVVCLETSCLENLLCCCACVATHHKGHITKPLRMVVDEARSQAHRLKANTYNIDVMLNVANHNRKEAFQMFEVYRQNITNALNGIQLALQGYYNSAIQQIVIKGTDSNLLIQEAVERALNPKDHLQLKNALKKIVAALPNAHESSLSEQELIVSLERASHDIKKSITISMTQAHSSLVQYQTSLQAMINNQNIWQPPSYAFGQKKHPDIKIIDQLTVKSQKNSCYKFAIMDPQAQQDKISTSFSYRIKECVSNWIGIGFCHPKIVASKNYSFSFGAIGHGAYMVSSNGGIWSHSSADHNNKIKAFKFKKGDLITAELVPTSSKIIFTKDSESYQIPFQLLPQHPLHPCVLFYYLNDEVTYEPKK